MARCKLTAAARKDLRGISVYTTERWGVDHERVYSQTIRAGLRLIAQNPEIGPRRDELVEGLRSFRVGQHIAYYAAKKGAIEVYRILHPAMDVITALKGG